MIESPFSRPAELADEGYWIGVGDALNAIEQIVVKDGEPLSDVLDELWLYLRSDRRLEPTR